MKKLICILVILIFPFILLKRCDNRTEIEIIIHNHMFNFSKVAKAKYGIVFCGRYGSIDKEGNQKIGLYFNKYGKISKDEGRKLLVHCVNLFLKELNKDDKF